MKNKNIKKLLLIGALICSLTGVATSAALIVDGASASIDGYIDSAIYLKYGQSTSIDTGLLTPYNPLYHVVTVEENRSQNAYENIGTTCVEFLVDFKLNNQPVNGITVSASTATWINQTDANTIKSNNNKLVVKPFLDGTNKEVTYFVKVEISEEGFNSVLNNGTIQGHFFIKSYIEKGATI